MGFPVFDIPEEIRKAAKLVENWMTMHGHREWVLYGIASRNLVDESGGKLRGPMLKQIKTALYTMDWTFFQTAAFKAWVESATEDTELDWLAKHTYWLVDLLNQRAVDRAYTGKDKPFDLREEIRAAMLKESAGNCVVRNRDGQGTHLEQRHDPS